MKCQICRKKATYVLYRHKIAFCKVHFQEHLHNQIIRVIKKYKMFSPGDRILVGISGGKDSLGLLIALNKIGAKTLIPIHINLGFSQFSEETMKIIENFNKLFHFNIKTYYLQDLLGFSLQEVASKVNKPFCSLCGTFKRYYLNQLAIENKCNVLVTGHNLDDLCAFLMSNIMNWHMQYLERLIPVLPAETSLVKKVKPLARLTDNELSLYIQSQGIKVLDDTCPYSKGSKLETYKNILHNFEKSARSTKAAFYFGYLKKLWPLLNEKQKKDNNTANECISCSYKTIHDEKCFICRIKERML